MKNYTSRIYKLLNSPRFFRTVLCFFVFESVWIALSATYPQAFDENFHFGLIQTYSHYWLPFISSQPPGAASYGAVARDPSYLYHYLMSFPYRLVSVFFHAQIQQVVILRIINIGLLSSGLILFRKILLRVGISRALSNVSILLFALIPIVPQLAAQINYDNLLIPLVAWVILISFDVTDQLRKKSPSAKTILLLLSLCLLTSLVKYAFLPIFAGIVLFLLIVGLRAYRNNILALLKDLYKNWEIQSVKLKIILVGFLLISVGMFAQRDIINLVRYDTVSPDCATVLNIQACKAYSVWDYSYVSHQALEDQINSGTTVKYSNIFSYSASWLYWMWYRLFFAVNGPSSSFTNYPPLPLPSAAAIVLVVVGTIIVIKCWRRIFHNNIYLVLLFLVSVLYIVALFSQGYSSYRYTYVFQNMNGRYLLPVIIFLVAIMAKGLSIELRKAKTLKYLLVSGIVVLFLQGGGFLTFIERSDDTWDLQNHTVQKVNDVARKITSPVIIDGQKQYSTNDWFFN